MMTPRFPAHMGHRPWSEVRNTARGAGVGEGSRSHGALGLSPKIRGRSLIRMTWHHQKTDFTQRRGSRRDTDDRSLSPPSENLQQMGPWLTPWTFDPSLHILSFISCSYSNKSSASRKRRDELTWLRSQPQAFSLQSWVDKFFFLLQEGNHQTASSVLPSPGRGLHAHFLGSSL